MEQWLTIVGIGEDGLAGLSDFARQVLNDAHLIIGSPRQLALLPQRQQVHHQPWPSPFSLAPVLAARGTPVCVLASGDPMFFGVGATLTQQFSPAEMRVIPAVSSCSWAAARLGWALQDVQILSLVARPLAVLHRYLYAGARILLLANDGRSAAAVASLLNERGFGASKITVLSHLGGPQEQRCDVVAQQWAMTVTPDLSVIAVEVATASVSDSDNANSNKAGLDNTNSDNVDARCGDVGMTLSGGLPLTPGLPDSAYRHDGQLTKRDVRAITLARLSPHPGALLWDVGAGCGSIGIEWMRSHPLCRAIAIEANADRQALIEYNSVALGAPGLQLVRGAAPEALIGLAPPDAIFIGGGVTVPGVLDACWSQLRSGGRLVANAVTVQSEMALCAWRDRHGGELLRIDVSHTQQLGKFDVWRSALPITLLEVCKL